MGMVAYMEEALKSKLEGFEGILQGNKLEEKMAKSLKRSTLQLTVALPLPSPVGFWTEKNLEDYTLPRTVGLIMSTNGHLHTQSHQEGTSDPTKMNLKRLARQFQSIARDVEEFKKGKSSATMDQRVGDNLGGFNSPHHQRPLDNVSTYGYHDMPEYHKLDVEEEDTIDHKKNSQDMKHSMKITYL
ncbi:hypothetical protein M9H77_09959 [Catharanthus roseus]|uniref:Uncharacterized protein n=1 Tax=Catharanthus roseus TaxID=4058 RepID=A0ACC0C233_CATRO|nr:hypothetical protein M9H77_09959 [Catharanthus roseus]